MTVSLIIPAFNEQDRLGDFLHSIFQYIKTSPNTLDEVIVVDDGSSDSTVDVASKYKSILPFQILKHDANHGKGAAVKTGVLAARGDYIVFMDADGATAISELPKMINALKLAQIGIGNRWLPGAKTQRHSFLRRLAGWVYRNYMSIFGLGSIDTMCGFKGYHRNVARRLFNNLIEERWLFDAEIAYQAVHAGYTIKNFPINWESKDGSKLDTLTLLKTALQIWPLIQKIKQQQH